jgi:hypothetical protein
MTTAPSAGRTPHPAAPEHPAPSGPALADRAPRTPGTRRRVTTALAWVVAVVVGGALIALAAGRPAPEEYLHPDGTGPGGTRALVEVLRQQGIEVDVVGTAGEVLAAGGPGSTVVVGNTDLLSSTSAARVLEGTADADRLVLLDGAPGVLSDLGLGVRSEPPTTDPSPGCSAPWSRPDDVVTRPSWALVPEDGSLPDGATGCFPVEGQESPSGPAPGGFAVLDLPPADGHPAVTVVGVPDAATNRFVTEGDNAGVLVRLLGGSDRLVWFHPTALDLSENPAPVGEQVWPTWLGAVLVLAGAAFLLFVLARGRRLGRLVPEPLPVVVRAGETTESRAELYRAARDRPRASAVLRRATATRLAARLGLPPSAPADVLVAAVAVATGTRTEDVRALLTGPVPTTDAELVALAQQLAHLEEKARRP